MSSNQQKDSKSFRPTEFPAIIIRMVVTLCVAWVVFNIVLAFGCWFFVRLTHYDLDPGRVQLAEFLTKDRMINLQKVEPGIQTIRHIFRLDTDGDGSEEWVVLYSYDRTEQNQGPYGAAVYDMDRCRPPAIVTYDLRSHDYNYVAENLSLRWGGAPQMQDVNADGKPELVFDFGNDLSIFRWFDNTQNCMAPGPGQQGYDVLGTFRGTGGVTVQGGGRIAVRDRGILERSQTVIKRVYTPDPNGSYLYPGDGGLYPPVEVGIEFAFGLPQSADQLYYPEKAVLAFYLSLGQNNKAAQAYLSRNAQELYPIETHDFGIALPRNELARVLVKELSYAPNAGAEQMLQPQYVTIMVVGVRAGNSADEANPRRVRWRVVGVPRQGALPYNCEWRLDSYEVLP